MISKEQKTELIKNFQINTKDTGSIEVQVALLTERINHLNEHFKAHQKDFASKMGLQKLVGRRRSFLDYLHKHNATKYEEIISRLNLRK